MRRRFIFIMLCVLWASSQVHAQVVGQGSSGAVGDPWYVTGTVTFSNTTINIGAALPAGGNTIGAVNLAQYTPNVGRLPVYLGDVVGTRSSTTDHTDSIQIGGTTTAGNEWNAAQVTAADPLANANGLVVRNLSATGVPGVSAPSLWNVVGGRDPVTNALRQMDLKASDPVGTENGLIVRNLPSGTQPISAVSLPLPAGASTSGLQTSGNTSLANIETYSNLYLPFLEQMAGGASPSTIASASGTLLALNSSVQLNTVSSGPITVQMSAGTATTGDVYFEATYDGGANWIMLPAQNLASRAVKSVWQAGADGGVTAWVFEAGTAPSVRVVCLIALDANVTVKLLQGTIPQPYQLISSMKASVPASTDNAAVVRNIPIVSAAGAVTSLTPRVTLASDDPAVVNTATLAAAVIRPGVATRTTSALLVQTIGPTPPLPLFPCNAVRRTNCQPKGY